MFMTPLRYHLTEWQLKKCHSVEMSFNETLRRQFKKWTYSDFRSFSMSRILKETIYLGTLDIFNVVYLCYCYFIKQKNIVFVAKDIVQHSLDGLKNYDFTVILLRNFYNHNLIMGQTQPHFCLCSSFSPS